MAEIHVTPSTHRKGRWYAPPAALDRAAHLKVPLKPSWSGIVGGRIDRYHGTAEQLAEAGLLPLDMFPGQPGLPLARVAYRPMGATGGEGWCYTPGYMEVYRNPSGTFTINLTVSHEEQERRATMNELVDQRRRQELHAHRLEEARQILGPDMVARIEAAVAGRPDLLRAPAPIAARPQHLRLVWSDGRHV